MAFLVVIIVGYNNQMGICHFQYSALTGSIDDIN
jgi:C1A family cysteine protease